MASHVEITNLYNKNKNVDGNKSKLIINSLYAGLHNKDVLKDINLEIEEIL
jgi:hemoglobin-like flavoprotein